MRSYQWSCTLWCQEVTIGQSHLECWGAQLTTQLSRSLWPPTTAGVGLHRLGEAPQGEASKGEGRWEKSMSLLGTERTALPLRFGHMLLASPSALSPVLQHLGNLNSKLILTLTLTVPLQKQPLARNGSTRLPCSFP